MNKLMLQYKNANDIDRELCNKIKQNIETYEKSNNIEVKKAKIKLEVTLQGLYQKYGNAKIEKSYILCALPIDNILKLYSNMDLNIEYIQDKVYDFKEDLDFYYVGDTVYIYMNI